MTDEKNMFKSNNEKLLILVYIVMASLIFQACPIRDKVKSFSDMTPQEKGAWLMSMYNAQYNDYKERAKQTPIPETEKNILRAKKKILTQVYPLIKMYISYIDSGRLPTEAMESKVFSLIDKLLKM